MDDVRKDLTDVDTDRIISIIEYRDDLHRVKNYDS